jgi:DNA adenine methylase
VSTVNRSFLRWAGSKRQLLPVLETYWKQSYNSYHEPFVGSACFFFRLQPSAAVLSDLNIELIRALTGVRDCPDDVSEILSNMPKSKERYYQLRRQDPGTLNLREATARFIYLNRFCFNGLYRTNLRGEFNVPFAPEGTGELPSEDELRACSTLLSRADLKHGDFEHLLKENVRSGDFVYLDPPFAVQTGRVFREYGPKQFNQSDLDRLASLLIHLDKNNVAFLVSYADCPAAKEKLKSWPSKQVLTRRNIAGFAAHRKSAYELVFSNIK